jgi:hypothetical protein
MKASGDAAVGPADDDVRDQKADERAAIRAALYLGGTHAGSGPLPVPGLRDVPILIGW